MTSIGDSAFARCSALTSITIPGSVAVIGEETFFSCSALTQIALMDGVQSIGFYAFGECSSLTSLSLPDSLTSIGDSAFYGCSSLTGITLPQGVASLGQFAFMLCSSLTEIGVDADNPNYTSLDGILFDKDSTTLVQYPVGRTDTAYVIPANMTAIGNGAFATCGSLASISIPESVTHLGDGAFYGCTGLRDIVLPGGLTYLGDYAFMECTALSDITFHCLTPPSIGDSSEWISETSPALLGHAWFGAGFPAPGSSFYGLAMGDYIAPPITDVSPFSPLTLYTQGTAAVQTFAASYENHGLVASATLAIDTGAPVMLDTFSLSETISLALGSHTITLTIQDAAGNAGTQTWSVTVVQDMTGPSISGIDNKLKVARGSPVTVNVSDELSGVNWDSLNISIDNKDITSSILLTADGFTIPGSEINKGDHTIVITIYDNVGNVTEAKYEFKVK